MQSITRSRSLVHGVQVFTAAVPLLAGLLLSPPNARGQTAAPVSTSTSVPAATSTVVPTATPIPACAELKFKLGAGDEVVSKVCQMPDGRQCLVVASWAGVTSTCSALASPTDESTKP